MTDAQNQLIVCSLVGCHKFKPKSQYKVHNQLTHYSLPIYCVPPARALKGHHKYSYQSIRALHDPYLYLFCTSYYRIWSILPVDIACAPSTETFKSRLIEAIRTGAIVVAPPRTVTTIHAGVGARGQPLHAFWDGRPWEGIKKNIYIYIYIYFT